MMTKAIHSSILSFALILIFGCVSDPQNIPPQITENPVFRVEGKIGGDPILIEAGTQDFILETQWAKDSHNIPFSKAVFADKNCPQSCGQKLEVRLYGDENGPDSELNLVNSFNTGLKSFSGPANTPDSIEVTFSLLPPEQPFPAFYWDTPTGNHLSGEQTIQTRVQPHESVDICLNTLANENCFATKCISFIPENSPEGCDIQLNVEMINDGFILIEANPTGIPPFSLDWKVGQVEGFANESRLIVPAPVESGKMMIEIIAVDATGCQSQLQQMIEINPLTINVCPLQLEYSILSIPGVAVLPFSTAQIIYQNEAGIIFQSDLNTQPGDSRFEILSVSDFNPTPIGDPTKFLDLRVKCQLFKDTISEPLIFESDVFKIGVAFPTL